MFKRPDPLDNISVATPCPTTWERMAGDDRVRHCTVCDLNVYNFAAMTRNEVQELITRTEGRLCARLYRRADGTLITKDCPTRKRRRVSRSMSAMLAGLMSFAVLTASGCTTAKSSLSSTIEIEIERVAASQSGVLTGIVADAAGYPLPGVTVTATNKTSQVVFTTVTDVNGSFAIGSLEEGVYAVDVNLPGFRSAIAKDVSLKRSEAARANVTLRFDATETVIVGAIAPMNSMTSSEVSTTFTQDLIDKLPH